MKLQELHESEERSVLSVMGVQPEYAENFYCDKHDLTSLEGCPVTIINNFIGYKNQLVSFNGGPTAVGGSMYMYQNRLESFEGAPEHVGKTLYVNDNSLSSFGGAPRVIGGNLIMYRNKIKSLKGIHKYIKQINGVLNVSENDVNSHILGVLRIEGLEALIMDQAEPMLIINRHLGGARDIFECQDELIEAGFEEFAKL